MPPSARRYSEAMEQGLVEVGLALAGAAIPSEAGTSLVAFAFFGILILVVAVLAYQGYMQQTRYQVRAYGGTRGG